MDMRMCVCVCMRACVHAPMCARTHQQRLGKLVLGVAFEQEGEVHHERRDDADAHAGDAASDGVRRDVHVDLQVAGAPKDMRVRPRARVCVRVHVRTRVCACVYVSVSSEKTQELSCGFA